MQSHVRGCKRRRHTGARGKGEFHMIFRHGDVPTEIIVDCFAGGGGASTGIELAVGRPVDIAIDHDPAAIAMHRANHPDTEHYCESVWEVDPRKAVDGRLVGLVWLSPDCKHFSNAKGGKPVEKSIRSLAWVAARWAATVRPRVIMLENVEGFKTWGPLLADGRPDPKQKGREFNVFVNVLKHHGYQVEWRELRACDYGTPTIRKRFFLVARRDGQPIVWPEPTHGAPESAGVKSGRLKPWRTASEIIDFSLPCPSIFERKHPLTENTMRRLARGIFKFVIDNPHPFIVQIDKPLTTVTTKAEHLRMSAFLAQSLTETAHGDARGQHLSHPILTLDTSNTSGLATSHMVKLRGINIGHWTAEPLHTVTAGGTHLGEVRAFLTHYYGTSIGQDLRSPINTISTYNHFGLVTVQGQDYDIVDIGMRMLEPHELFAAQGFPSDYIIDRDADGNAYPKSAQVARCGNAVPPPFAEALVRANLPEMCEGGGAA